MHVHFCSLLNHCSCSAQSLWNNYHIQSLSLHEQIIEKNRFCDNVRFLSTYIFLLTRNFGDLKFETASYGLQFVLQKDSFNRLSGESKYTKTCKDWKNCSLVDLKLLFMKINALALFNFRILWALACTFFCSRITSSSTHKHFELLCSPTTITKKFFKDLKKEHRKKLADSSPETFYELFSLFERNYHATEKLLNTK